MRDKVKIIMPDKVEIGKDFTARVEWVESPADSWPDGTLLMAIGGYKVYYVENGELCHIETQGVFDKMGAEKGFTRTDIKEIPQNEIDAGKKGKSISQWPEDETFPPGEWAWVKGILTEGSIPSLSQISGMNFNVLMPFGWLGYEAKLKKLADAGIKLIPKFNQLPANIQNDKEKLDAYITKYNIIAFFIYDEPEFVYPPEDLVKRAKSLRIKTNLPFTINFTTAFWMDDPSWMVGDWHLKYPEVFAELDFVSIDSYWYRYGSLFPQEYDRMMEACRRIRAEGKDILGIGQGHEDPLNNITKPDMVAIADVWKREGAGNIWYLWQCVREGNPYPSIGARPEDKWYNEQIRKINADK